MLVIYNGGVLPTLAIQDNKDSHYYGWLFYQHPDGKWVTLADVKAVVETEL